MELTLEAQNAVRIELQQKSTEVPSALLAALENSKPIRSLPQEICFLLSQTSQIINKSLSSLVNPTSSSLTWKVHEHGVPTGLFRLPLEIREQIYGLVTGHETVFKIPENYHKPLPSVIRPNNGPTSILQTCRQIYAEAIRSIYTQNTFHFQNHNDLFMFAHAVNPLSLSHITSLTFDLNSILRLAGTPCDFQCPRFAVALADGLKSQWSHFWSIIAAMDNLIELKVFLQDPGSPEWDGMQCLCVVEKEILAEPLKVKRSMRVFEIDDPWVDTSSWVVSWLSSPLSKVPCST